MGLQSGNTIVSGIEPVDELLGGLESGQLYMVHGEASGKSLFGIKFLIEGLKQGENGALVIRYSPEDAVRRFARLGYDCLEDVYSGRLVILEYSDDIVQKIGKLRALTPVLRELEWLLGETRPSRLMFDPVTSVLAGTEGNIETRAREFAEWARSFGATVVLVGNGPDHEVIKSFEPLVSESFRFDIRAVGDNVTRYITFEKSPTIPDQAIEVDPTRGVFLLGSYGPAATADETAPRPPSVADLESIREELRSVRDQIQHEEMQAQPADIDLMSEASRELTPQRRDDSGPAVTSQPPPAFETSQLTPAEIRELQAQRESERTASNVELDLQADQATAAARPANQARTGQYDELSDLLDDLAGDATPLELDLPELESGFPQTSFNEVGKDRQPPAAEPGDKASMSPRDAAPPASRESGKTPPSRGAGEQAQPSPPTHVRAADLKIESVMTARTVELLLRPPQAESDFAFGAPETSRPQVAREPQQFAPLGDADVEAKDFNVLIIEDDMETCDLLTQTLGDYTLEVEHDGVSGIAKLISFKPDLVVLDFDLPIIDGFKILTLIRSALNVPIIILSGSRMRAIDRVMAAELGADHYLTKPFSAKELKHKARQLIARYRGITSWIVNPWGSTHRQPNARQSEAESAPAAAERGQFVPYAEFASEVERRVKAAIDDGTPFSIVGCRLPQMTAGGGRIAIRLLEIARGLARETDLTSTNPRNDLVIMLGDAGAQGAGAFAGRLRERVIEEMGQEPSLWMRSFPDLEESTEATEPVVKPRGEKLDRRSGDRDQPPTPRFDERPATKADPRESFIDFLDHL